MQNDVALLELRDVSKLYKVKDQNLHAVDHVSLTVQEGECLGIVGESGCGKSTLARMTAGIIPVTGGKLFLDGKEYTGLKGKQKREFGRNIQMVFQDPYSSFSPRMKVGTYLTESRRNYDKIDKDQRKKEAGELLEKVGLPAEFAGRYPHELSGGQLQRVAIARAISISPRLLICDEATGALDVSIQNHIARLLVDLVETEHLGCLFIGHDIALVRSVSQRIAVMYLGRIVELVESEHLSRDAVHPYTRTLLNSIFDVYCDQNETFEGVKGEPPSPLNRPKGCAFADRCGYCTARCREEQPELKEDRPGHAVACFQAEARNPEPASSSTMAERKPAGEM